jgi:hypothetical protein
MMSLSLFLGHPHRDRTHPRLHVFHDPNRVAPQNTSHSSSDRSLPRHPTNQRGMHPSVLAWKKPHHHELKIYHANFDDGKKRKGYEPHDAPDHQEHVVHRDESGDSIWFSNQGDNFEKTGLVGFAELFQDVLRLLSLLMRLLIFGLRTHHGALLLFQRRLLSFQAYLVR